jgi:hypothetical protein
VQGLVAPDASQPAGAPPPAGASVARLTWSDAEHRSAHLTCYLPRSRRWVSRDVAFSSRDPELERGRTLGFLVAAMLLEEARTSRPERRVAQAAAVPPEAVRTPSMAVSAAVTGAAPGNMTGLGAWMSGEYLLVPRVGLGAAADARFGSIPAAQATAWIVTVGVTSSFELYRPSAASWLAVRATGGAVRIAVTRLSEDDPEPEAQARWAPLVELAARAGFGFARDAGVFAELGLDTTFSRETVPIDDARPAAFPALFPVARVGVSAGF